MTNGPILDRHSRTIPPPQWHTFSPPLTTVSESPYSVYPHVMYLIIPLPGKVFISAEHAEKMSWDLLSKYENEWPAHKALHQSSLGLSVTTGDRFATEINARNVVARTYLTYGWKYKHRMMQNAVAQDFKSVLLYHDLPRFVWVTEFGTINSLNDSDFKTRRIFSHAVIDATSSKYWEGRCIFHAPGFGLRWFHNPQDVFGSYKDAVTPIMDDQPYYPKLRGHDSFDAYKN